MSREKQIEEMWNIIITDCDNNCDGCEFENDDWCFTHRVINNLYNAGYRKQEWISVDERLPEVETPVLIFTAKGRFYVGYYYKAAVDAKNTGFYADACRRNVTHWMPLPEAPKMKGGGE